MGPFKTALIMQTGNIAEDKQMNVNRAGVKRLRRFAHVNTKGESRTAPNPDERAMEEWKQFQVIIGRYDGFDFSIRGWLLVLVGAAITARFSSATHISAWLFLVLAFTA